MENLLLFVFFALLAEMLGTIGGFGSSLLFVPLAGFFFDFYSVLGITALFHLASNVSKIALFRTGVDKRLILMIGIPSVLFVIAGAYLSRFFNARMLESILAIFLIGISLLLLVFKKMVIKPTGFNSVCGGVLSGFSAGLLGTGGAIRGLTLAAFNLEMNAFIATSAIIDLGVDLSRSIVYFSNGYMLYQNLYILPILIGVGFTGSFIGKRILQHFTENQFKSTVLLLVLIIGIVTLAKQLAG